MYEGITGDMEHDTNRTLANVTVRKWVVDLEENWNVTEQKWTIRVVYNHFLGVLQCRATTLGIIDPVTDTIIVGQDEGEMLHVASNRLRWLIANGLPGFPNREYAVAVLEQAERDAPGKVR